jgi:hypothetical protein
MPYSLTEIRRVAPATYDVVLTGENGRMDFMMRVEGTDIEVVTWGEDFSRFVSHVTAPAGPIFEAVLRFHRASKVQLP